MVTLFKFLKSNPAGCNVYFHSPRNSCYWSGVVGVSLKRKFS